jgi:hypothetical protein
MQKNLIIGISIVAACVVVCASYSSVVGVQLVKASNDRVINDALDQKELLFQTIVDMANSKEVQKVILSVELMEKRSFAPCMRFSAFTFPMITEKFLKRVYTMAVLLSRTFSKSRIQAKLERYQGNDQAVQKKLAAVVEKDTVMKAEVAQLSSLSCDCENANATVWHFPIICTILTLLIQFLLDLGGLFGYVIFWIVFVPIILFLSGLSDFLHCIL